MSKRLVNLSDAYTHSESVIAGQLVDSITNVSNIGIFARRIYEVFRLEKFLLIARERFQKKEIFLLVLNSVQGALIAVMLGFMVYFLIHLYGSHSISIGDFALILGLSIEVAHITGTRWSKSMNFIKLLENANRV